MSATTGPGINYIFDRPAANVCTTVDVDRDGDLFRLDVSVEVRGRLAQRAETELSRAGLERLHELIGRALGDRT